MKIVAKFTRIAFVYFFVFVLLLLVQQSACNAWYAAHAVATGGYIVEGNGVYMEMSFEPGIDPIPYEWIWMITTGVVSVPVTVILMGAWENIVSRISGGESKNLNITKRHVEVAFWFLVSIIITAMVLWPVHG